MNAVSEEEKRVRRLRNLVDLACSVLYQGSMSREEASRMIAGVKRMALELFPDKEETFDMIYGSRLRRILCERFPLQ